MIQIPVILFTLGFAAAIVNPEASLHPQPAAEQPKKPEVAVNALAAPARITATLPLVRPLVVKWVAASITD